MADLAGRDWPEVARKAALSLSATAQESNPLSSLLLDIFVLFIQTKTEAKAERMFTRTLVAGLNSFTDRPWMEMTRGREVTDA